MACQSRGEKISAAKRGKPLVARSANEITVQQAVRETGRSAKVLREGAARQLRYERGENERPGLRHRRLPHANGGEVILFDRAELVEDLARLSCQWCDQPAPGDSGRCRRHQAKKYATVKLVCDWGACPRGGEPFTRYGSVNRSRADRGDTHTFCSDRCEMLWLKATIRASARRTPRSPPTPQARATPVSHRSSRRRSSSWDSRSTSRRSPQRPTRPRPSSARTHPSSAARSSSSRARSGSRSPRMRRTATRSSGRAKQTSPPSSGRPIARGTSTRIGWSSSKPARSTSCAGRGFTLEQARAAVRATATARRRRFIHRRTGAPRKQAQRAELRRLFYEVRAELADGWSQFQVCVSVADRHFRAHPQAWPKYAPAADGGLRPEDVRRAAQRVWAAVR